MVGYFPVFKLNSDVIQLAAVNNGGDSVFLSFFYMHAPFLEIFQTAFIYCRGA